MRPEFVKWLPYKFEVEQDVLYISEEFGSCLHLCPCGCGNEVFLRLGDHNKPNAIEWTLIKENNDTVVSIMPSIQLLDGCKSHYWITKNIVHP